MAVRQLYKRRELPELEWISVCSNPVDAMTNYNYNKSLYKLMDTNELIIKMKRYV